MLVPTELPLRSSPLTVSYLVQLFSRDDIVLTCLPLDQKQARELVSVLQEAKQQIDPRLAEMARFGGGGGRGWGGWGRGRGRGRGGGGSKF